MVYQLAFPRCKRVPFFPIPSPAFNICIFFNDDHSDECEVILHCNFVLHFSNNYLILFILFLAICMYSLEKCVIRFYAHFFFLFLFNTLSCMSYLYILEIYPLSVVSFADILFHFEGCLSILFMVSFAVQKLLSLIRSHLFCFYFHYSRMWVK